MQLLEQTQSDRRNGVARDDDEVDITVSITSSQCERSDEVGAHQIRAERRTRATNQRGRVFLSPALSR